MRVSSNDTSKLESGGSTFLLIRTYEEARSVFAVVLSIDLLFIIFGIIVNVLISVVMVRGKRYRRNTSNFFILHLSVTELIYRLLVFPIVVYFAVPATEIESFQCKSLAFFSNTCSSVIFGSLVAIAEDRYQSIVHPLKALKSKRNPFCLVLLVWLYAAVVTVVFVISIRSIPVTEIPEAQGMNCTDCADKKLCDIPQDAMGQSSTTLFFLLAFVVPLIAIVVLYTKIAMFLHKRTKNGMIHKSAARSKSKAVRMLVVAVNGYVVSLGPAALFAMLRSYGALNNVSFGVTVLVNLIVQVATYTSSLANPLIYAYYNGDFRKELLKLFTRRKKKVSSSSVTFVNTGNSYPTTTCALKSVKRIVE